MKKTIYISGPISGRENNNFNEFAIVEEKLNALGHETINPHTICEHVKRSDFETDLDHWCACMRLCLSIMCQKANYVVTLKGWEQSRGATIEVGMARELCVPVESAVMYLHKNKIELNTTANAAE